MKCKLIKQCREDSVSYRRLNEDDERYFSSGSLDDHIDPIITSKDNESIFIERKRMYSESPLEDSQLFDDMILSNEKRRKTEEVPYDIDIE